jgi:hypothetical protein
MDMEQKLRDAIEFNTNGKTTKFKETVFEILNQKVNDRLDIEKISVAQNMFKDEEDNA